MKAFNVYLLFNGNCRQAMEFYAKSLGADLQLMTYGEGPGGGSGSPERADSARSGVKGPGCEIPHEAKDKIMHARLQKDSAILMASDCPPNRPVKPGNNFSVNLDCESAPEIEKLFSALSDGATITMPLQGTFWAARFGMLTDKFGINWMFNLEQPKPSNHAGKPEEHVLATK